MKKILQPIILFLILFLANSAQAEKFREINSSSYENDIPVLSESDLKQDSVSKPLDSQGAVKDTSKKLYGIVGKSQVINFDEPLKRVSLTDGEIADIVVISPKQVMVNGKKGGSTSLVFWSKNSTNPIFYNLLIRPNTDGFLEAVEHIAPNENISVIFDDNGAVLTGKISSRELYEQIERLAKQYNIKISDALTDVKKQVLLEVKVVEASKTFARNIGLNLVAGNRVDLSHWSTTGPMNNWSPDTGNFHGNMGLVQTGDGGLSFGFWRGGKLGLDFEAFESKGDIKILAEPKMLVLDREEGEFNVGNEVPVPSSIGQYGNVSYEYKDTGVILKFKPTILDNGRRVRLHLEPAVSEVDESVSVALSSGQTAVYGFKTREVKTDVELMDGETLIIAGLLNNTASRSRNQVPILGNIPIIGTLFSTTQDKKADNELVIFITPRIVDNSYTTEDL